MPVAQYAVETPIVEYVTKASGTVATVNVRLAYCAGSFRLSLHTVPATRVGRTMPDWPRALSLRPDLSEKKN